MPEKLVRCKTFLTPRFPMQQVNFNVLLEIEKCENCWALTQS